jgi:hypothetical protein
VPTTKKQSPTGEKVMQTWRMPKDLIQFLRSDALKHRSELTPFATKLLNAYRNFYEVPTHEAMLLEEDRKALKMGRFEYLQHVLSRRSLEVQKHGLGYDLEGPSPGAPLE